MAHLLGSDDGSQREPVAHALRHGDDVRRHAVRLEAPEVVTGAAETRLDLMADVLADMMVATIGFLGRRRAAHMDDVSN